MSATENFANLFLSRYVNANEDFVLVSFRNFPHEWAVGCVAPFDAPLRLIGALEKLNAPYGISRVKPLAS